jgi:hypothetical protein
MKIGKSKYGSDFVPTKYWKLKDGESTFRILPPLGDLADDGIWSLFYKVHYGYRNSQGRMRVFQSCLETDRRSKMVTVPDAAVERIERLKMELEKAKSSGNRGAIEKFKQLLQQYNLDNNHYVNAIDTQGNIGVLKLRHRAKQALDAAIKKLNAQDIDPLGPDEGRFFTFTRTGTGLDTTFQVAVAQESLNLENVGLVKRDLVHKLTPEIIGRLGKEARELHKLFKKLTSEEIGLIVKESDLETGKSPAVDRLFDVKGGDFSDDGGDYDDGNSSSGGGSGGGYSASAETSGHLAGAIAAGLGTGGSVNVGIASAPAATLPSAGFAAETQTASASAPSAQTTAQKVSNMNEQDFQNYLKTLGI